MNTGKYFMNGHSVKDNKLCFERILKDFVWRFPGGTIVNMGNFTGSTYEKVRNGEIKWYELELPDEFEQKSIPDDGRILIRSTILKDDWLERIRYEERIMFAAEGIFSFCGEKRVKALISRMCMVFPSFELLFDLSSPSGMRTWNYVLRKSGRNKPVIGWCVRDPGKVIKWNTRFRLLGIYRVSHPENSQFGQVSRFDHLLLKIFCRWKVFHIRVRHDYKNM